MQVSVILRSQEWLHEDLDVATAFARNDRAVQNALIEAIRQVQLPASVFQLLKITSIAETLFQQTWQGSQRFRNVFDASRQEKFGHRTEETFYKYAEEKGIMALSLLARDKELLEVVDQLPEEELIKLVNFINLIPIPEETRDVLNILLEGNGLINVPTPYPIFVRPRRRGANLPPELAKRSTLKRKANNTPESAPCQEETQKSSSTAESSHELPTPQAPLNDLSRTHAVQSSHRPQHPHPDSHIRPGVPLHNKGVGRSAPNSFLTSRPVRFDENKEGQFLQPVIDMWPPDSFVPRPLRIDEKKEGECLQSSIDNRQ